MKHKQLLLLLAAPLVLSSCSLLFKPKKSSNTEDESSSGTTTISIPEPSSSEQDDYSSEEVTPSSSSSSSSSYSEDTTSDTPVSSEDESSSENESSSEEEFETQTFIIDDSKYEALNGKEAKNEYRTAISQKPSTLNYLTDIQNRNTLVTDNVISGLMTYNEFGMLDFDLAESMSHNDDYTEWTFTLRDDFMSWIDSTGKQVVIDGIYQVVKASDFYATYYLMTNSGYSSYSMYYTDNIETVITDDDARTVTYKLTQPEIYFPTYLALPYFRPICTAFFNANSATFGAADTTGILYNGPFYLSTLNDEEMILTKNEYYASMDNLKDYQNVHVDRIYYQIITSSMDVDTTRTWFESGDIDGFALNKYDTEGWQKYITGPNEEGTIYNPYDLTVNNKLSIGGGTTFGSNINMERSGSAANSYCTYTTSEDNENTKLALRLQDVRQVIMKAFDYEQYFKSDSNQTYLNPEEPVVHSYMQKDLCYDEYGNEYVDTYFANAVADYKGISLEEAKAFIKNGQYDSVQLTNEMLAPYIAKAQQAIEDFNDLGGEQISLPIKVETLRDKYNVNADTEVMVSMNSRLNGFELEENMTLEESIEQSTFIQLVPITSSSFNDANNSSAYDFALCLWGWAADYSDPNTYMHSFAKGGDWSSVYSFIGNSYVPNYRYNEYGELEEVDLLQEYTELVEQANSETSLSARYALFAQAEVLLINELNFYVPRKHNNQWYSLAVSRVAGYDCPHTVFGCTNRMSGIWTLTEPLTRDERQIIQEEKEQIRHDLYD